MSSSSGSLFFTGLVAILIVFQITVLINFYISNTKSDLIIEKQNEIIEKLTLRANLSDADKQYMEKLGLKDYEECIDPSNGGSKELCTKVERLLKMKWGDDILQ